MTEKSEEATFSLICSDISKAKYLSDNNKKQLVEVFSKRFLSAYETLEAWKVKKYVFHPSGRVIWIVTGNEGEYQIFPLANFCSCPDFYFRVISHEKSFCYHLIAQKLAEVLKKYVKIIEKDTNFPVLMEKWRNVFTQKREFSRAEIEHVRKVAIEILLEKNNLGIDRFLVEIREAGFGSITTRQLANILISDQAKRFNNIRGFWMLNSVNIK